MYYFQFNQAVDALGNIKYPLVMSCYKVACVLTYFLIQICNYSFLSSFFLFFFNNSKLILLKQDLYSLNISKDTPF